MRAPEPMSSLRLVGPAEALDGLQWTESGTALRLAPDDLLVLGSAATPVDTTSLLAEADPGWVGWWLTPDELGQVRGHVDWPVEEGLNQGLVAGVPAKLWLGGGRSLLLVAAAYAHELVERLP